LVKVRVFVVLKHFNTHLSGGVRMSNPSPKLQLSEKENKLIQLIRNIEYGEIRVIIQDRTPIRIEEMKKSIKL